MISLEFAFSNMLSPAILFFILGVIAVSVKSDLEIPDSIGSAITLWAPLKTSQKTYKMR